MLRRLLVALALAVPLLAVAAPADAASVCAVHAAGTPYVSLVQNGVTTLAGSGGVAGCQSGSSVTITVSLQMLDGATWVDQASVTHFKFMSPRYAKQDYQTVKATCAVGDWRILTVGDGYVVAGPVARFSAGDSGVCGSYGGGDKRRAPSCANEGPLLAIENGMTQAYVEDHLLSGYTGSLNETVHRGDGGVWDLKGKWYDLCGSDGRGSQVSYRRSVAAPDGWHVKQAAYYPPVR